MARGRERTAPTEEKVSVAKEDTGELPNGFTEEKGAPPSPSPVLNLEVYQREDKWWSFRVNGKESHYRSSNRAGLDRTLKALLFGTPPGTVKLRALHSKSGGMIAEEGSAIDLGSAWADLPTPEERMRAFLARGSLAPKQE